MIPGLDWQPLDLRLIAHSWESGAAALERCCFQQGADDLIARHGIALINVIVDPSLRM
jgi:hypothetical protein